MRGCWAQRSQRHKTREVRKTLGGSDASDHGYEEPQGFSLSIYTKSAEEAERIYHELARSGQERMPLDETCRAERFGMVVDRIGIHSMINCGEGEEGTP